MYLDWYPYRQSSRGLAPFVSYRVLGDFVELYIFQNKYQEDFDLFTFLDSKTWIEDRSKLKELSFVNKVEQTIFEVDYTTRGRNYSNVLELIYLLITGQPLSWEKCGRKEKLCENGEFPDPSLRPAFLRRTLKFSVPIMERIPHEQREKVRC